jgi:2-oxo-3-hexenedioate decarboxylase
MTSPDRRLAAGMAKQARLREQQLAGGARRAGWKAGFGTASAMAKLGTDAPLVGFLTDATRAAGGGTVSIEGFAAPRLEPEVAVALRGPISPAATPGEIVAAVQAVAPAIEIIDLGPADDLEELLAANIFHRAYLIGPFADADATRLDGIRVDIHMGDAELRLGVDPAALLGRVPDILGGMARQLPLAGAAFAAGDVVITGSVIPALELSGGEAVRVSLTTGEAMSVTIAPRVTDR